MNAFVMTGCKDMVGGAWEGDGGASYAEPRAPHLRDAVADAQAREARPLGKGAHDDEVWVRISEGDGGAAGRSKLSVRLVEHDDGDLR